MCIAELRRYRRGRRGGGAGRKRGRVCVASRTVIDTLDVRVRVYARLATQRAHGARARTARGAAVHAGVTSGIVVNYSQSASSLRSLVTLSLALPYKGHTPGRSAARRNPVIT